MNNYLTIYWLTRLDILHDLSGVLLICGIIILFVYFLIVIMSLYTQEDCNKYHLRYKKIRILSIWVVIISGLILTFIPTKSEMILIYAGGKTMDYVQADTSLSKIPYQTTTIISNYLDNAIKELNKK